MTTETTVQPLPRRSESGMHSRAINAAAGLLAAATEQGHHDPIGQAIALDAAGLLNSPEHAREFEQLLDRLTAAPIGAAPEQRAMIAEQLADARPATISLVASLAKAVSDVREHEHPKWEDLYCSNLTSFMGERMGPVLRRLLDAEARVVDLEARLAEYERPADEDPIAYALISAAPATTTVGDAPALKLPSLAVTCPYCAAKPGDLCTSHSGTRPRLRDVHTARTLAWQNAAEADAPTQAFAAKEA